MFVHPIDTAKHPTIPPGFRWSVVLGDQGPLGPTMNAGWCPTASEASVEGEMVGVAVAKGLHAFGIQTIYTVQALDHDPIPAEA